MNKIPNQVKLPIGVAMGVVLQGLRIRLGRSIVTITGVTCGIAFLMSILTGQLVKQGVAEEDATRAETGRVQSFMRSELPKIDGKSVGIVGAGQMSEVETRIAESLQKEFGAKSVLVAPSVTPRRAISSAAAGDPLSADLVIIMGDGEMPKTDWSGFLSRSLANMLATTIPDFTADKVGVPKDRFVVLARVLSDADKAKMEADKKKEKFRTIWIGVISLLVTIIGITNAMLMSVTERFREIGTMKCLGALSSFVTQMFVLEASIMGLVGGIIGALGGALFAIVVYSSTYSAAMVFGSMPFSAVSICGLGAVVAGIVLSVIAALYPARVAAAMVPATALRSSI